MEYETFKKVVLERFLADIPEPKQISVKPIRKNNGVQLDGLVVMEEGYNISPTIYLNYYYDSYLQGDSLEQVYERMLETYRDNRPSDSIDVQFFVKFENARKYIVYKLIHREKNRELLEEIPYVSFMDLAIVFYSLIPIDGSIGNATILIKKEHMQMWDTNEEELFEIAKENTPLLLPAKIESMLNVLSAARHVVDFVNDEFAEAIPEFSDWEEGDEEMPMVVVSNSKMTYGAAVMLYEDVLKRVADRWEDDLYILPSSVHEVIVIPQNRGNSELEELNAMIYEINQSEVAEDDILSDHAYLYDRESGKITMEG